MFARLLVGFINRTGDSGALRVGTIAGLALMLSAAAQAGETGARPRSPSAWQRRDALERHRDQTHSHPRRARIPMAQSRTLAIFHAAIHDALNAIDRRFESYTPGLTAAPAARPSTRRSRPPRTTSW